MREPTAAQALYPHLRQGTPEPVRQRTPNVADAMWPKLSRATKAAEADQRTWDAIVKRNRDNLVRGLSELNARVDARLGRR
jgi:hypothetical protein